jgi:hypothetical protein
VGEQIALLTDRSFSSNHGLILKSAAAGDTAGGVRRLYDEVTALSLRMMSRREEERGEWHRKIRERISVVAGIPIPAKKAEEGA